MINVTKTKLHELRLLFPENQINGYIISTKDEYTNFPNIPPINNYIQYNYMNDNVINFSYGVNSTYFINYE